jgi:hypothetical protein
MLLRVGPRHPEHQLGVIGVQRQGLAELPDGPVVVAPVVGGAGELQIRHERDGIRRQGALQRDDRDLPHAAFAQLPQDSIRAEGRSSTSAILRDFSTCDARGPQTARAPRRDVEPGAIDFLNTTTRKLADLAFLVFVDERGRSAELCFDTRSGLSQSARADQRFMPPAAAFVPAPE